MYKVIMVPTDGSDIERPAIALAVRLARRFKCELRLVRIDTTPVGIESISDVASYPVIEQVITESRLGHLRDLKALAAECRGAGDIRVVTALEEGAIAPTLAEYATRFNVDLIVMPSHGWGGVKRLALGSVADYLIRHTSVPVLVVKPSASRTDPDPDRIFKRIVVPLDGSELAEQILPQVADVASQLNASVHLLQVLTPLTYSQKEIIQPGLPWWDDDMAVANSYLAATAGYLTARGLSVTEDVVLSERVGSAIMDYSQRVDADLLAIATNGSGGVGRFLFGSVADDVMRNSEKSVLLFHPVHFVNQLDRAREEADHKVPA